LLVVSWLRGASFSPYQTNAFYANQTDEPTDSYAGQKPSLRWMAKQNAIGEQQNPFQTLKPYKVAYTARWAMARKHGLSSRKRRRPFHRAKSALSRNTRAAKAPFRRERNFNAFAKDTSACRRRWWSSTCIHQAADLKLPEN